MIRSLWERPGGWVLGVVVACALVLLASVVSYISDEKLRGAIRGLDQAHRVSSEGADLLSSLALAEGGVRGYALTGDRRFLARYRSSDADAREAWRDLDELLSRRARNARFAELSAAVADKHRRMAGLAAARSDGSPVDLASLQGGRTAMERINRLVHDVVEEERARYARNRAAAERQVRLAEALTVAGTVAALVLIVLVFAGMRREIASRRRAEESLRALSSELEQRVAERTSIIAEQGGFLRAALQSLHHGIIAFDGAGRVTFVNREARRIDPALEVGARVADLAPTGMLLDGTPVDMSESKLPVNRALRGETVQNALVGLVGADGDRREVSINAQPIADEQGARLGAVLSMDDVTERRATEEQLRQATKMEAVGQLTGGLAHDFNNLLSIVIGNLDLLESAVRDDPDAREQVETALSASLKGAEMTRQLLAFSRRQPLSTGAVGVNDLVRGMEPLLRQTAGETVSLVLHLQEDMPAARVDRGQLESALLNLGINARDAMREGGRLTVETKLCPLDEQYAAENPGVTPGDYVLLAVSDTGMGIAPEHLGRVFEPFFTTKEVGAGSGLGLSMIYGFAKQSGGHLKIYSEVGHGTTVRLYLPLAAEQAAAAEAEVKLQPPVPAVAGGLVLVVEDNPDVRRTVVTQLATLGYATLEAGTASEALEHVRGNLDLDLVFTDVVMPGGMDGPALGRAVAELRPELPVLYTSGFAEAALVGAGIDGERLLTKPYRKEDLGRKVAEVLSRRSSAAA